MRPAAAAPIRSKKQNGASKPMMVPKHDPDTRPIHGSRERTNGHNETAPSPTNNTNANTNHSQTRASSRHRYTAANLRSRRRLRVASTTHIPGHPAMFRREREHRKTQWPLRRKQRRPAHSKELQVEPPFAAMPAFVGSSLP